MGWYRPAAGPRAHAAAVRLACHHRQPEQARCVLTTPSHQYPLGTRLAICRRLALLTWAQANDSLIIEDDYDSEFRFDTSPLPALASLDEAGRVAYIGTFSKVLTPALRIGDLVAPPRLCE